MHKYSITIISFITLICAGCDKESVDEIKDINSRPVTVLQLEDNDFMREINLTGSVNLYREEKVGFEVSGRILAVEELGKELEGPAYDEDNKLVRAGEIIATMDDTRYRLRVDALQERLNAAQQGLKETDAALKLARQTLDRQINIHADGAGKQQAVDDAQSNFDSTIARKAKDEAVIREITNNLNRAIEDLEDTRLRAPFSGRITKVHVTQGAVVDAAVPVVTLSLMDPIQVQVEVSADEDRRIQTGDRAILYPDDPIEPEAEPTQVNALVYEKGAVADPNTRTFRIDLMARNERRRIEQIKPETRGLPLVKDYLPVVRRFHGEVGKLYVPIDSIYYENGKHFVLRLPGVSFHPGAKRSAVGKHIPDKVEVSLDDDYFTVIKWNFRSLKDSSDLQEGDFLALGPRKEHLAGLAIGRPQWLLRPGDLVPVSFLLHSTTKGLYVPVNAITMVNDKHIVYLVEDNKAVLREITVHDSYQELRRIEGTGIEPGAQLIVGGVHYVFDAQAVKIVGQENLLK